MWAFALLGQVGRRDKDPLMQPEVIWGTVALAGALLAGAAVIYAVDKWRKRAVAGTTDAAVSLTDYRGMYERGEITEEEYARLRERVAHKVKAAVMPGPPAPGPPPPRTGADAPAPPADPGNPTNPPPSA